MINFFQPLKIISTSQKDRIKNHDFRPTLKSSVRQTNSAVSNLSLNIQRHVEVPKSNFFWKK